MTDENLHQVATVHCTFTISPHWLSYHGKYPYPIAQGVIERLFANPDLLQGLVQQLLDPCDFHEIGGRLERFDITIDLDDNMGVFREVVEGINAAHDHAAAELEDYGYEYVGPSPLGTQTGLSLDEWLDGISAEDPGPSED